MKNNLLKLILIFSAMSSMHVFAGTTKEEEKTVSAAKSSESDRTNFLTSVIVNIKGGYQMILYAPLGVCTSATAFGNLAANGKHEVWAGVPLGFAHLTCPIWGTGLAVGAHALGQITENSARTYGVLFDKTQNIVLALVMGAITYKTGLTTGMLVSSMFVVMRVFYYGEKSPIAFMKGEE